MSKLINEDQLMQDLRRMREIPDDVRVKVLAAVSRQPAAESVPAACHPELQEICALFRKLYDRALNNPAVRRPLAMKLFLTLERIEKATAEVIPMAKCENCVHNEVCPVPHLKDATICPQFKNREKYAEVVRCKDCKHYVAMSGLGKDFGCSIFCGCYDRPYPTEPYEFCSYGERNDSHGAGD